MTLAVHSPAGATAPAAEIESEAEENEGIDPDAAETQDPAAEEQTPPDETEEVEHEGKKYKIPRPLKGALLMQADYTRKTQELAEQRRAHEETARQFADRQKLEAEFATDFARVVAINDAIAQFEKTDWAQIRAGNPAQYEQLWFQYQQTKEARDRAASALQQKLQERSSKAVAETAKRLEEARTAIQRDIPEWNPELAGKLNAFAIEQGFTPEEVRQVADARIIRLLHAAYAGRQLQSKQAAVARAAKAEAAKPLPTVAGNAGQTVRPTDPASDRLSTDEWARRRNEQLRKRSGR